MLCEHTEQNMVLVCESAVPHFLYIMIMHSAGRVGLRRNDRNIIKQRCVCIAD